jgi:hypothetical protein
MRIRIVTHTVIHVHLEYVTVGRKKQPRVPVLHRTVVTVLIIIVAVGDAEMGKMIVGHLEILATATLVCVRAEIILIVSGETLVKMGNAKQIIAGKTFVQLINRSVIRRVTILTVCNVLQMISVRLMACVATTNALTKIVGRNKYNNCRFF